MSATRMEQDLVLAKLECQVDYWMEQAMTSNPDDLHLQELLENELKCAEVELQRHLNPTAGEPEKPLQYTVQVFTQRHGWMNDLETTELSEAESRLSHLQSTRHEARLISPHCHGDGCDHPQCPWCWPVVEPESPSSEGGCL